MKKNSLRGYLLKGAHLCGLAKGAKRAPSKSVVLYGHGRVKKDLGLDLINFFSVSDANDKDNESVVLNLADDTVVSDSITP